MLDELATVARAAAHGSLSSLHRPLAAWRFRRAVKAAEHPLLVCAGAGDRVLQGWLNTDVNWRARFYLDLMKPWPVPRGSVSRVYTDNVIEHFRLPAGRVVLKHMFDALKPGGRVRLATPDVERTAVAYLCDPDLAALHLERHRKVGYDVHYPVDLLRVTFAECGHHVGYCYDWNSLSTELRRANFIDVQRFEPGESDDHLLRGLEARMGPSEARTSLIVEACRPA